MTVYNGLNDPGLARHDRVLAVGAFDGVHRGHQRLLNHVCRIAHEYGVRSAIMTFEPIPAQVFRPAGPLGSRLTLREERNRELSRQCIHEALIIDFDEQFRAMSAADFAREVLVERLGVIALVASKTHSFGRNAEADVQRIAELGMELGFEVHVLPPILVDGERVNSTELRGRLWEGDVAGAADWLGRPYDLAGVVAHGRGIGHEIGFPTANLVPDPEKLVPAEGVYACAARIESEDACGEWLPAAVSIGTNPTVGETDRTIEAYLLAEDVPPLYEQSVRLLFLERLRDQIKFPDVDALTRQIAEDVKSTRALAADRCALVSD